MRLARARAFQSGPGTTLENREKERELDLLKDKLTSTERALSEATSQLQGLQKELLSARRTAARLQAEVQQKNEEVAQLKSSIQEKSARPKSGDKEVHALRQENAVLREQLRTAEEDIATLENREKSVSQPTTTAAICSSRLQAMWFHQRCPTCSMKNC